MALEGAAVSLLLHKLEALLSQEASLLGGLNREVQDIKHELDSMRAFLEDADERQESDRQENNWVKEVRDLAHEIEDCVDEFRLHLKNKACEVKERSLRYSFTIHGGSSSGGAVVGRLRDPRLGSQFVEEADLMGIEEPKRRLADWLTEDDSPLMSVIAVVGMGGLGKTTLVKQVYQQEKALFDCSAWIIVSQPFEFSELLRRMIKRLSGNPGEAKGEEELIEILRGHLQNKRYVIVLDDIWSINAWEGIKIGLPENQRGSRIMVTTRNEDVAYSSCTYPCGHVYRLAKLSHQQARNLFCRRAFPSNRESGCPPELEVSESILENIKIVVNLSYDDLPFHLKTCFLYLSIYPGENPIKCMRLVRLWMAGGFVTGGHGDNESAEDIAMRYLTELINRSMVQVTKTDPSNVGDEV